MARKTLAQMKFSTVYPLYVQKAERKGRTREEVDELIRWLTGYNDKALSDQIARNTDFATFFAEAPALHPNAAKITGVICGYRIEDIADPVEKKVRWMDKLIDELAKGRAMEKIKRSA